MAPKIVPFSTHALLQRGERVTITCTMAKGDVPLNILWLKDGSPLSGLDEDDTVKILTFDHFNSMLTIESLELRHVGNYTCQAANLAGTASHSQAVLVNGKTSGEEKYMSSSSLTISLEIFLLELSLFNFVLSHMFCLKQYFRVFTQHFIPFSFSSINSPV